MRIDVSKPLPYTIDWDKMSEVNFEMIQRALQDELERQYGVEVSLNDLGIPPITVFDER